MSSSQIAALNDAFRQQPGSGWHLTAGVQERGIAFVSAAVQAVRTFASFTPENDPYGEHDFGSFEGYGQKLFWKIDCYAKDDLSRGSEDPSHPARTTRVIDDYARKRILTDQLAGAGRAGQPSRRTEDAAFAALGLVSLMFFATGVLLS